MARKSRRIPQNQPIKASAPVIEESKPLYKTGIYCRLSIKDLGIEDGDTMETQIALLRDYVIEREDMELTEVYVDNGWTGTNFNRPEFNHMLEDMEYGRINCIVVKDLSRLGRNYLEAGYYQQEVFPSYKLRFIAVYDGYDSLTSDSDSLFIGTKNIINDYYSKDISKKVSTAFDIKRKQAPLYTSRPPFGYIYSTTEPKHYVIDKPVAPYVRLIFDWALSGKNFGEIVGYLNDLHVPTPQQRYDDLHGKKDTETTKVQAWKIGTIQKIISNRTYTGDFVCGRTRFRKYDPANNRVIPEEDWIIHPNVHDAYITHEEYEQLKEQDRIRLKSYKKNSQRRRMQEYNHTNPFNGILFCGECHRPMRLQKTGDKTSSWSYVCTGISNQKHAGHPRYSINFQKLLDIAIMNIQLQINLAVEYESFLQNISSNEMQNKLKTNRTNTIRRLQSKLAGITNRKQRAFEDLNNQILEPDTYQLQVTRLDEEARWLQGDIERAKKRLQDVDQYFTLDNEWLQTFLKARYSKEIDSRAIHLLIHRVEIWQDEQIHITYNFGDWMMPLQSCIEELRRSK